jgi:predicted ester cyclase
MKKLLCVVPVVLLLCFTLACQDKAAMAELKQMKAQAELEKQNELVVRQVFEAIDAQDFARFRELLAPEIIVHYSGPQEDLTFDTGVQLIRTFYQAFPDYSHKIEDVFAKGDKVAIRMLQQATHKAEFQGLPPTGNKVQYYQTTIMQVKDGMVIGWWIVEDNLGFMTQLGMELKLIEAKKK